MMSRKWVSGISVGAAVAAVFALGACTRVDEERRPVGQGAPQAGGESPAVAATPAPPASATASATASETASEAPTDAATDASATATETPAQEASPTPEETPAPVSTDILPPSNDPVVLKYWDRAKEIPNCVADFYSMGCQSDMLRLRFGPMWEALNVENPRPEPGAFQPHVSSREESAQAANATRVVGNGEPAGGNSTPVLSPAP
ncbi:hypothetical protein [Yinghuangia soli]|uniref:Lipoprotein n=1 Tax=Yinghuangia soli TaxID=2908204 RepID=A0AA41Q8I3_9ACTN|nr:hypothetical protein [Yinghuangia soli]MCF2533197.1 hypothetical protein [Yinghuangia soli]